MKTFIFVVLFVSCFSTALAGAEVVQSDIPESDWKVAGVLGIASMPKYLGDDESEAVFLPDLRASYRDWLSASFADGLHLSLLHSDSWRFGPLLKYDFGREERDGNPFGLGGGDIDDLNGLGDIDPSVELGAFARYVGEGWAFEAEVLQGLSGGHEGTVATMSVLLQRQASLAKRPVFFEFGPQITFADSTYMNAYFGTDNRQSMLSGLPEYTSNGGIMSFGIGVSAVIPLSEKIAVGSFLQLEQLSSEATDSPLVDLRGEANQFTAGAFVSIDF